MKILIPFFKVLEKGLHLESSWVILNLFNYWSSMGFVVFELSGQGRPAKLKKPHFHKYTPENPHFSIPKTAIFFKAGGGVESTFFPSGPYHFGYIYIQPFVLLGVKVHSRCTNTWYSLHCRGKLIDPSCCQTKKSHLGFHDIRSRDENHLEVNGSGAPLGGSTVGSFTTCCWWLVLLGMYTRL